MGWSYTTITYKSEQIGTKRTLLARTPNAVNENSVQPLHIAARTAQHLHIVLNMEIQTKQKQKKNGSLRKRRQAPIVSHTLNSFSLSLIWNGKIYWILSGFQAFRNYSFLSNLEQFPDKKLS